MPRKPRTRRKPQPYQPPFESCSSCSNGWLLNDKGEAYRCWCWRKWQEEKESCALANHQQSEQWSSPKHIPGMDVWLREERWRQTLPPVSGRLSAVEPYSPWECHHLEQCSNQTMCAVKDEHPSKYPVKAKVSA